MKEKHQNLESKFYEIANSKLLDKFRNSICHAHSNPEPKKLDEMIAIIIKIFVYLGVSKKLKSS